MAFSRVMVTVLLLVLTRMLVSSHDQVISALDITLPPDDNSQATPGDVCSVSHGLTNTTVHASHGDVMLTDTDLVLICINSQWVILDGEDIGPTVPDTLCRQLGYEDGSATFERSIKYDRFSTLWLQHVHCPVDYQAKHILRCNFILSGDVDRSYEMHLRCSSYSTRNPGMQHNENTYIGQVALVPPVDRLLLNLSRSWGVITIKHYSGRQGDKWDYIRNTGGLLTLNDTDTICREMGYTHSVLNSLQTVKSLRYRDDYSFELNAFGRMNSSQFSCLRSYQCAGCCFNVTIHDDQELSIAFTSDLSAFVIKCAFYTPVSPSTSPVSGGYKEICEASPEDGKIKNKDVCQSSTRTGEKTSITPWFIGLLAYAVIATTIAGLLLSYMIILRIREKCRRNNGNNDRALGDEEDPPEDEVDPPEDEEDPLVPPGQPPPQDHDQELQPAGENVQNVNNN